MGRTLENKSVIDKGKEVTGSDVEKIPKPREEWTADEHKSATNNAKALFTIFRAWIAKSSTVSQNVPLRMMPGIYC